MEEKKFIDIRTLSLEHIVSLKSEKGERFRETISSSFSGHDFQELKKRILKGETPNNDSKIQHQTEYIGILLEKLEEALKADTSYEMRYKDAQEIYNQTLEKLEEAKQMLKVAEGILKRDKEKYDASQESLLKIGKELEDSRKSFAAQKRLILIHPSATLKKIMQYKDGIFMVTKVDEKLLRKIGCVDTVFEVETAFVQKIPEGIRKKYQTEELLSLMSYAEMVIHISLSENNPSTYKLLYSNPDIKAIVKANGFEL